MARPVDQLPQERGKKRGGIGLTPPKSGSVTDNAEQNARSDYDQSQHAPPTLKWGFVFNQLYITCCIQAEAYGNTSSPPPSVYNGLNGVCFVLIRYIIVLYQSKACDSTTLAFIYEKKSWLRSSEQEPQDALQSYLVTP